MAELYSSERPGRPVVAAGICAALLVAVLALAWLLCRARAGVDELGSVQSLEAWPLRWRPPAGWEALRQDQLPPTVPVGLADRSGRRIYLLCDELGVFVPPRYVAEAALARLLPTLFGPYRVALVQRGPAVLGPLAASQSSWLVLAAGRRSGLLIRQAVSPTGQAYGLLLATPRPPRRRDRQLLNRLAEAIELQRPGLVRDADELAAELGLKLSLPDGVRLVSRQGRRLVGHAILACPRDEPYPWTIELWRSWLSGRRTVQDLLHDRLVSLEIDPQPGWPIRQTRVAGRAAASAVIGPRGRREWIRMLWAAQITEGSALLIEAIGEPAAEAKLAAICQELAESVRLLDRPPAVDLAAAERFGQTILKQLAEKGLSRWWSQQRTIEWFLIREVAGSSGLLWARRQGRREAGKVWFETAQRYLRRLGGRSYIYSGQRSVSDERLETFESRELMQYQTPFRTGTLQVRVVRPEGGRLVLQTVVSRRGELSGRWPASQNLLPAVCEELAYFLVAKHERGEAALFESASLSGRGPCTVLVRPMATDSLQPGRLQKRLAAVCLVQRDFDPEPTIYLFAADGSLLEVRYGDGQVVQSRSSWQEVSIAFAKPDELLARPLPQPPSLPPQ